MHHDGFLCANGPDANLSLIQITQAQASHPPDGAQDAAVHIMIRDTLFLRQKMHLLIRDNSRGHRRTNQRRLAGIKGPMVTFQGSDEFDLPSRARPRPAQSLRSRPMA